MNGWAAEVTLERGDAETTISDPQLRDMLAHAVRECYQTNRNTLEFEGRSVEHLQAVRDMILSQGGVCTTTSHSDNCHIRERIDDVYNDFFITLDYKDLVMEILTMPAP